MGLAALSWGLGVVMTKVALEQLTPLDVLGTELLVGAAVVVAALLARGGGTTVGWRSFALLGLLEPGLSYALGDFGLQRTGAADGALLIAPEGLFAVVLARAVLSERVGRRARVAVGVGFLGSVGIGAGAASGGHATLLGDLLVLASTAAAAAYSVAARRVARAGEADALVVTAVQLAVAAIVSLPLVGVAAAGGHSHLGSADGGHLLAGIATGLLTTGVPFLLFNTAIRDVEVAGGALITNLIPVIGAGFAVLLLGDMLGPLQVLGGLAVVGAALSVEAGAPEPRPA
jgi:drug/metabolite transporter (DMT)-like permease